MPFSEPHFLVKLTTLSVSPSETTKYCPDGITKRFLPILTLLRLFGMYPLKFGTVVFGSGKTNKATIRYSVDFKSKSCSLSMLIGILMFFSNIVYTICFLYGDLFGADVFPDWL
jgi:hypothetical protein